MTTFYRTSCNLQEDENFPHGLGPGETNDETRRQLHILNSVIVVKSVDPVARVIPVGVCGERHGYLPILDQK